MPSNKRSHSGDELNVPAKKPSPTLSTTRLLTALSPGDRIALVLRVHSFRPFRTTNSGHSLAAAVLINDERFTIGLIGWREEGKRLGEVLKENAVR
jgi:hypothetical protein